MDDPLTKDDVRKIVDDALQKFAEGTLPDAIVGAMAQKIELTFGVDCKSAESRDSVRDDMKFLHSLRDKASKGGEKVFLVLVGLMGSSFLYWAIGKFWPDGQKYLH